MLDENGKSVTVTMGSYGIGVSRAVAALAETNHDDAGLAWPAGVAPAHVYLVAAGKDEAVRAECEELAADLHGQGVEVIYDDRKASPGVKFADAELIGVPIIVTVGRSLADGVVEVRLRRPADAGLPAGERPPVERVPVQDAAVRIGGLVASLVEG